MIERRSQVLPGSGFAFVDPAAVNDAGFIVGNGTTARVLALCSNRLGV
jgi:hypothetical protein